MREINKETTDGLQNRWSYNELTQAAFDLSIAKSITCYDFLTFVDVLREIRNTPGKPENQPELRSAPKNL